MKRSVLILLAISLPLWPALCLQSADPPAKPFVASTDETPALRKQLTEATATISALQRRLRAIDQERQEAQGRIVLLVDENLRLTEELAKRSETKSK